MKIKVGAVQMCSVLDFEKNLKKIRELLREAKFLGATHVFLPEAFYSLSDGLTPTPFLVKAGEGEHFENIKSLATSSGLYILGGSAATLVGDKIFNRSYNFAPNGDDLGHYDKRNLFSCELEKNGEVKKIDEGVIYSKGSESKIITAQDLKVGISICFDLRYPMIYREYALHGANLLSISSAFTIPTGKAHWHTLVRARAIENQCFVVASAQWGMNNERISTYGHSLIVSPWGEVLADAKENERVIVVDLDLDDITRVRKSVKVF